MASTTKGYPASLSTSESIQRRRERHLETSHHVRGRNKPQVINLNCSIAIWQPRGSSRASSSFRCSLLWQIRVPPPRVSSYRTVASTSLHSRLGTLRRLAPFRGLARRRERLLLLGWCRLLGPLPLRCVFYQLHLTTRYGHGLVDLASTTQFCRRSATGRVEVCMCELRREVWPL
jgi:hypothetical protein